MVTSESDILYAMIIPAASLYLIVGSQNFSSEVTNSAHFKMAARARSSLPMPSFYHATLQLVRYKSTQHNGNSDDVTKLLPTAFDQVGNKQKPAGENDGDQVKEDSNKSTTDIPPPALSYPPEHYFDTHQIVTNFQAIGWLLLVSWPLSRL